MTQRGARAWIPFAVFLLSGVASLMDEIVWFKYLVLTFGATTSATATLVAVFMGGLALGSALAARLAARVRHPGRAYALLETGVAVFALATPGLFSLIDRGYILAYPHAAASPAALLAIRFLLAAVALLPPTILMGATLPVLARAVERGAFPGRPSTALYAVNTAGAVAGVALSGFVLIPRVGLWATLVTSACLSLVAALLAMSTGEAVEAGAEGTARARIPLLWLAVAFATGAAALADEVLWTRVLVLYIGSSVYAFSLMLAVYLTGLVAGSFAAAVSRPLNPRRALGAAQIALAFTLLLQVAAFSLFARTLVTVGTRVFHASSWAGLFGAEAVTTALFLFPPTLLRGFTFGALVRAASLSADGAPRGAGAIYASNTLGGIFGSLAAGFLAIPALGSQNALLATGLVASAVALALCPRSLLARLAPAAFVLLALPLRRDGVILSAAALSEVAPADLLYYKEDVTATVAVKRFPGPRPALSLELNGVNVAGTSSDLVTIQKLQAHLPLAFCEQPRRVLHIGFGSGGTAYCVSLHPVSEIRIVEISPEVIDAAVRFFQGVNHNVLADPRAHLTINDGRNFVLAAPERFDAILSDSIHPRYAGNGSLYTEEYFRLCARRLEPGGVISMWLPMYSLLPDNYRAIVRAFQDVFGHVSIWYPHSVQNPFTIVLATSQSTIRLEDFRRRVTGPAVAADLNKIGQADPAELLSNLLLAPDDVARWVAQTPPHSDELPLVEYQSGRTIASTGTWAATFADLVAHRSRLEDFVSGLDRDDPFAQHVVATYTETAQLLATQVARLRARAAIEP